VVAAAISAHSVATKFARRVLCCNINRLEIEFDAAKDEVNRSKHKISLVRAAAIDLSAAAVLPDDRRDFGELRFRAYGPIGGRLHMMVFTMRGSTVRVISLRKANKKEIQRYGYR
jgi:uncharacterized DUF497 family protein